MKILIIGGGNMGRTYAQCFIRSHITTKENLVILEKPNKKPEELPTSENWAVTTDPAIFMSKADLVILAVKPQDSQQLFEQIKPYVDPQQVFLSVMAGVKMKTISEGINAAKIIRAMPNLPAQIGMGMTAFTSTEDVTRIELVMVQNLINTTGKSVYVENENLIDAATAISGSGPAYVWFYMNALIQAAKQLGFNDTESELLVSMTVKGAIDLFQQSDFTCEQWIQRVASKGGTTEAALKSYNLHELHKAIISGAESAFERAKQLGNKA